MELDDPLLIKYRDVLRAKGLAEWLDLLAPDAEVLGLIESLRGRTLGEALDELSRVAAARINREAAAEAYAALFGVRDEDEAVSFLARRLARWYLGIAEALGLIRLR
ncbi:MAG: hypothetical protein TU35_001480 [Thermoproteus sp. AZ2]|jgi:hypothetical protein|uniref:Uncharacterized protein n=1 Tax=Thermoproteus sp. AZ2 TaxID=1609232 RepID=A0ACC6UYN2_9CREN|nr:MAG: hypothetical protein TU35_02050 [Thermoproteus sp. AZ2]